MAITKFQQGGSAQQDPMQQFMALVQAAAQGDQQAQQALGQIVQAAQQGDQQAQQLIQPIADAAQQGNQQAQQIMQVIAQVAQGMTRAQRFGGRMAYIHKLRTGVNPDEEVVYERCGGKLSKKVVKKQTQGGHCPTEKKFEKKVKTYFECKGGKTSKISTKKCYFGGSL